MEYEVKLPERWQTLLIQIGYEIEMRIKDEHYPINYEELLGKIHELEENLKPSLNNNFKKDCFKCPDCSREYPTKELMEKCDCYVG